MVIDAAIESRPSPVLSTMEATRPSVTFTHARRIAGYNWPLYAAAACGILAGAVVASYPGTPPALRWAAALGIAVAAWFAAASFWAFHWMFDRSELLRGQWVGEEAAPSLQRWVLINAGLEETTIPLREVFPNAEGKALDIFDPASMTEPAITRARRQKAGNPAATVPPDALPIGNRWADLVLVMLAAHEIRDRGARERFFHELARIVSPDGKVVLVEHLRDLAAALAFGPGMFHFLPRREWLGLGSLAGLQLERERRMTPFVRIFTYRPRAGG
jgi:SAM-dependent methyltransferase